jgi:two-component system response regulator LytT
MSALLEASGKVTDIAVARDADEAMAHISTATADAVFLDISMPGKSGIALALEERHRLPPVVFVTGHSQFAVSAFDASAIDYLLKPVSRERLKIALDKLVTAVEPRPSAKRPRDIVPPRIIVSRCGRQHVINPLEVARFSASVRFTTFRHADREFFLDETLSSLESRLSGIGFFRLHRHELINIAFVKVVSKTATGTCVHLSDGQVACGSRRKARELKLCLTNLAHGPVSPDSARLCSRSGDASRTSN